MGFYHGGVFFPLTKREKYAILNYSFTSEETMDELLTHLPKEYAEIFAKTQTAGEAASFYVDNRNSARYMFGYPAHYNPISPLTQYLLLMHYASPFSNNCGDIEERGNYTMDTKEMEKRIVGLYAEKFGMGENFWGYITSGGSESNSCGIALAFSKNPHGILYYSASAHYSVEKYAERYPHMEIPTIGNDVMDVDFLCKKMEDNYYKLGAAANLVLTHGTTKYGVCDDVETIARFLEEKKIPHYIHVDAALFGGIQNNQTNAPVLTNAKARGVDSVCVSLHKYVGFPDVKSVFVATEKPQGKNVSYIGQNDTTVSGSRSIPAYALYNHIVEHLSEKDEGLYERNVLYFENLLKERGIPYYRAPLSNTFVIDEPSETLAKKYQLSCFDDTMYEVTKRKAHIIIFPSHREKEMIELANDLKNERL